MHHLFRTSSSSSSSLSSSPLLLPLICIFHLSIIIKHTPKIAIIASFNVCALFAVTIFVFTAITASEAMLTKESDDNILFDCDSSDDSAGEPIKLPEIADIRHQFERLDQRIQGTNSSGRHLTHLVMLSAASKKLFGLREQFDAIRVNIREMMKWKKSGLGIDRFLSANPAAQIFAFEDVFNVADRPGLMQLFVRDFVDCHRLLSDIIAKVLHMQENESSFLYGNAANSLNLEKNSRLEIDQDLAEIEDRLHIVAQSLRTVRRSIELMRHEARRTQFPVKLSAAIDLYFDADAKLAQHKNAIIANQKKLAAEKKSFLKRPPPKIGGICPDYRAIIKQLQSTLRREQAAFDALDEALRTHGIDTIDRRRQELADLLQNSDRKVFRTESPPLTACNRIALILGTLLSTALFEAILIHTLVQYIVRLITISVADFAANTSSATAASESSDPRLVVQIATLTTFIGTMVALLVFITVRQKIAIRRMARGSINRGTTIAVSNRLMI